MAGSASKTAEGVGAAGKAGAGFGSASRSRRRAITSDSSILCLQKTR